MVLPWGTILFGGLWLAFIVPVAGVVIASGDRRGALVSVTVLLGGALIAVVGRMLARSEERSLTRHLHKAAQVLRDRATA
jgi:hypothetical protein